MATIKQTIARRRQQHIFRMLYTTKFVMSFFSNKMLKKDFNEIMSHENTIAYVLYKNRTIQLINICSGVNHMWVDGSETIKLSHDTSIKFTKFYDEYRKKKPIKEYYPKK